MQDFPEGKILSGCIIIINFGWTQWSYLLYYRTGWFVVLLNTERDGSLFPWYIWIEIDERNGSLLIISFSRNLEELRERNGSPSPLLIYVSGVFRLVSCCCE